MAAKATNLGVIQLDTAAKNIEIFFLNDTECKKSVRASIDWDTIYLSKNEISDFKGAYEIAQCKERNNFFLICRRARRQRSQSPVLGTLRIDKHFELYKRLKTKRKIKEFPISLSSDGAYEQIPFDSPISKKERGNFTIQLLKNGHHPWL